MPKTSRKAKPRAQRASGRKHAARARNKHATRARKMPAGMQARTDDEAHIDGCDLEFSESDVTPDTELPKSTGGVETVRSTQRRTARQRK